MTFRHARLAVDIFTAIVAISIGVALAGLSWRVLGDPGGRVGSALVAPAPRQRAVDIGRIIALAPFGAATTVTQATGDGTLQLRGILFAQPRSASAALISVGGAAPTPFYLGQQVGGGGTIDSIGMDRVLLRSDGGLVTLAFPNTFFMAAGGARQASDDATMRPSTPEAGGGGMVASVQPDAARSTAPATAPPPADFVAALGAVAVTGGYRVGASLPPALRAAGLQPGDIIQRVNGVAVGNPARDAQLFGAIAAAGSAQLDLMRNGQPISIAISLR